MHLAEKQNTCGSFLLRLLVNYIFINPLKIFIEKLLYVRQFRYGNHSDEQAKNGPSSLRAYILEGETYNKANKLEVELQYDIN